MPPLLKEEKTLVIIKPDGVKRGLTGEIIRRIEQRGLKIVALKMIWPNKKQMSRHYPNKRFYLLSLGNKTLETYNHFNLDPIKELGVNDPLKIGRMVRRWLIDFMTSGPIIKMIVEGIHAVEMVRKLVGPTMPAKAEMGTIRGDFSIDSAVLANAQKRAVHNLIHASGSLEEAESEIKLWFSKEEIHSYYRAEEDIMF